MVVSSGWGERERELLINKHEVLVKQDEEALYNLILTVNIIYYVLKHLLREQIG